MDKVTIIGVDLAKRSFQVHGASADGSVLFRKKLSRAQVVPFLHNSQFASLLWRLVQPRMIGDARLARSVMR